MTPSETTGMRDDHAGPGVALRAARTAQNLSVGEVARQLRLSVAQVEALEANAFERLPGPVFVRGFLRNYARLLHLDPDVVLRSLAPPPAEEEAHVPAIARGKPMPAERTVRWPRYAVLLVMLLAALAAYELYLSGPVPVEKGKAPAAVPAPIAPPASEAPARAESVAAGGAQIDAEVTPEAPVTPPPSPVVAAARGSIASSSRDGELHLTFQADSWVEVRDRNGKTIFSRLNPQGTDQRVRGTPPLVVVVGNPRGVRLTYNDRLVDLDPHIKRDVARLTLE